ncbi:MAG TPA: aminoacetone oxidase family FAD-binding enzyme [Kiritimatiellia bacterium]|nr:aminoacetone oxidase family FAD-binding enzyme [Kiritimatiellia bacterium]
MTCSTLIIGGGPAGLTAACFCAQPAIVVERLASPARKLAATGGGRCNLTHATDGAGIIEAFGRQGRFMTPALNAFPPAAIRDFFDSLGVQTQADPDGCVFPASQRAVDVCRALEQAARAAGTELRCGVRAERLLLAPEARSVDAPRVIGAKTSHGPIHARNVILAAGGQSYPALGADGSGLALAREAGLTVTPPLPALAGLYTAESWPTTLAGIVLEQAALRLDVPGHPKTWLTGPVLFTHKGISGVPALDLSGTVNALLAAARDEGLPPPHTVALRLAGHAGHSVADWRTRFEEWRLHHGGRALHNLLSGEFPRAFATALCTQAGAENIAVARAKKSVLEALAMLCAECPISVTGTESWERAMLTRGGVALSELDPRTLACRRRPGLFCVGEVVDLDGRCGGYNLTWAFASGRLAGVSTS